MKEILIFSAGPAGREVYQLIQEINKQKLTWKVIGYVDSELKSKKILDGLKVFSLKNKPIGRDIYAITGIMNPILREKIFNKEIIINNYKIPNLIHPNIYLPPCFKIGKGNIIFNNVHISFEVKLSNFSIISNFCDVGHNLNSKNYLTLMPSVTLGGNCTIGKKVLIGSGVNILQKLKIDENCQIGIGSTITSSIPKNTSLVEFKRNVVKRNDK